MTETNNSPLPTPVENKPFNAWQKIAILLGIVALVISLFACYAVFYFNRQTTQYQQIISQQMRDFKANALALKIAQSEQDERRTVAFTQLSQQFKQLEQNFNTAMKQSINQNTEWLLLRARYYLELAQINAHWQAQSNIVLALLNQADKLLASIQDQRIFNIRQQLAKDISAIKALPELDKVGLLSQLDALQIQLKSLTIEPRIESHNTVRDTSWRSKLNHSWESLQKLIVIRHTDINNPPLLTSAQKDLWIQMIQLQLQEAQWAVLQNNEAIFHLAIQQAMRYIQQNFTLRTSETKSILETLQNLEKTSFVSHIPDLSQALKLLNQLLANETFTAQPNQEGTKI